METNAGVVTTSTPKQVTAPAPSNPTVIHCPIVRPKSPHRISLSHLPTRARRRKHENKRRREDTHSFVEGDISAGTSMLDTS